MYSICRVDDVKLLIVIGFGTQSLLEIYVFNLPSIPMCVCEGTQLLFLILV